MFLRFKKQRLLTINWVTEMHNPHKHLFPLLLCSTLVKVAEGAMSRHQHAPAHTLVAAPCEGRWPEAPHSERRATVASVVRGHSQFMYFFFFLNPKGGKLTYIF